MTTQSFFTRALRQIGPAWSGVLAAATSLGIATFVAGLLGVRSPVIAVGDTVISLVPLSVKDFAVRWFGTNDKVALIVGILVLLAIAAMAIGMASWKSLRAGVLGLAVFAVIGIIAGARSIDPLPAALIPAPVGAFVGFIVLRELRSTRGHADGRSKAPDGIDRRRFLGLSGGFVVLAIAAQTTGRLIGSRMSAIASRAAVVLPIPARKLSPVPAGADLDLTGLSPFVTPNKDFYRIDTALTVPQVSTDGWTLRVFGMVDHEYRITWEELLAMPMVETDMTLTCVSNEVGGDLISNARWLGVPLKDLLDRAGVDPQTATQVVGRSTDGFETGFPTATVYDGRDALVAIAMNGEPLPIEHGFPARIIVAGLYGYVSATKWLKEIELTRMEDFDSYWVRRGWAKEGPIKTESRIDVPKALAKVKTGKVAIAGVAWAQTRGISKVEVRIDNGDWTVARLGEEVSKSSWRQWVYEWEASPGGHTLSVRATDDSGVVQTAEKANPIPDGASGYHSIIVTATDA